MSRQSQHLARHYDRLWAAAAIDATYSRGDLSVSVCVVPARTGVELADDAGAAIRSQHRDYLVKAADLVLGGQRIWPEVGDRILLAETGETLEVQPLAGEHARACDDLSTTIRVHTRLIQEI